MHSKPTHSKNWISIRFSCSHGFFLWIVRENSSYTFSKNQFTIFGSAPERSKTVFFRVFFRPKNWEWWNNVSNLNRWTFFGDEESSFSVWVFMFCFRKQKQNSQFYSFWTTCPQNQILGKSRPHSGSLNTFFFNFKKKMCLVNFR